MIIIKETTIKVRQHNDPKIRLKVSVRDTETEPDTVTAYDWTGVTEIEFRIKKFRETPDAEAALYTRTVGDIAVVGLETDGVVDVQVKADSTAVAGPYYFRLDALRGALRTTVMAGPFIVEDN